MNNIIAAIATPKGLGGISIIRLSGYEVLDIFNKYFTREINGLNSHTINYGYFIHNNEKIDEILLTIMKGPNSFTGEDVVEINCHGGIYITNKILELLLTDSEISLAAAGEFTKRAFLNGKKSLIASQAVNDLIMANNEIATKMALKSMNEDTSRLVESLRQELLEIITQIEVNIDYPEYQDLEVFTNDVVKTKLNGFNEKLENVILDSTRGEIYKNGLKTVIIGAPNVGKSTLLNRLSRSEKAIVTEIAGTTRDAIEVEVNLGNITLNLVDTAGIHKTDDIVEKIGVNKSYELINDSELTLFILDGSRDLTENELKIYDLVKNKNHIVIVNKIDLELKLDLSLFENHILISASQGENISNLESGIIDLFDLAAFDVNNSQYLSKIEDTAKLRKANSFVISALEQIEFDMPVDIVEIDLKEALFCLGEILGIEAKDDLINEMFSRFCLGK